MTDYAAKVAAGVKVLDREVPNWRSKIDVDNLDLGSCSICILGQVFGDYNDGLNELNVDGYDHGFNTTGSYNELTAAWKEALGTNNVLVEKGDIYKDAYGSAVKVLQTHLVRLDDDKVISTYVVQTGLISNGVFKGDKWNGVPSIAALQKSHFEASGTYSIKVTQLKLETGMFITSKGKNYFVHSPNEVRELVDGAYAVNVSTLDLSDAKEMHTGMGVKFSQSVKRSF